MEVSSDYAVQMHGITKVFGTFRALDGVNLDVRKQSIHAILGENGAGKSTLMNVLYGLYQADEGDIFLNGEKVDIQSPTDAITHGIGMVHQHFMLVENFTVTENIVLGDEVCGAPGILDPKAARARWPRSRTSTASTSTSTPRSRTSPWACSSASRSSRCSTAAPTR